MNLEADAVAFESRAQDSPTRLLYARCLKQTIIFDCRLQPAPLAFRNSSRAARVKNKKHVFGVAPVDWRIDVLLGRSRHRIGPANIARLPSDDRRLDVERPDASGGVLEHNLFRHVVAARAAQLDRAIGCRLERHQFVAAPKAVRRHDECAFRLP